MNDNEFWVKVWIIVSVTLVLLLGLILISDINTTNRLAEAKDPIAFACAYKPNSNAHACLVMSGRR